MNNSDIGLKLAQLAGRLDALAMMILVNAHGEQTHEEEIAREVAADLARIGIEMRLEYIKTAPLDEAIETVMR